MKAADHPAYPDWHLLETWIAVFESAAVSQAARRLGVSQAAISQRVKQLEAMLNTVLLDRTTRPARPTAAGERLYRDASELLLQLGRMSENVHAQGRTRRSLIRIGCIDSFASALGATLYKGLSAQADQIRLWSGITPLLEAQFDARQLDIVITTHDPAAQDGVARTRLFSEPYLVALPSSMEPAHAGSLSELGARLPLIRYSIRSNIGQQIERYLQDTGDVLAHTGEFDASDPLLSLVAAGVGFAITTPMCLWQSRHLAQGLRVLPLHHFRKSGAAYPAATRHFHMASRSGELGCAPLEAARVMRLAMQRQLVPQMAQLLGLPHPEIWTDAPGPGHP